MGDQSSGRGVQITVAAIGLVGVLGAAAIANFDKLFPPRDPAQVPTPRKDEADAKAAPTSGQTAQAPVPEAAPPRKPRKEDAEQKAAAPAPDLAAQAPVSEAAPPRKMRKEVAEQKAPPAPDPAVQAPVSEADRLLESIGRTPSRRPTATPAPTSVRAPPVPQVISIDGTWRDAIGSVIRVTQHGDRFDFTSENFASGLRSAGHGQLEGQRFLLEFTTNVPSRGGGSGFIAADGTQMNGDFYDSSLGRYSMTYHR